MASLGHFNVAIVGGGPAGTALIIRAAREGRLRDLLGCDPPAGGDTADPSEAPRGLVLIEGGGRCNLGVGMLKKYHIRSNTACSAFLRVFRQDSGEEAVGPYLEPLQRCPSAAFMANLSLASAPLPLIGSYLTDVGAYAYALVERSASPSAVMCRTHVTGVCLQEDGSFRIDGLHAADPANESSSGADGASAAPQPVHLTARHVVLATGGRQQFPAWIQDAAPKSALLLNSDDAISERGILATRRVLRRLAAQPRERRRRVIIVGGAHSAFSAAWVALHRAAGQPLRADAAVAGAAPGGGSPPSPQKRSHLPPGALPPPAGHGGGKADAPGKEHGARSRAEEEAVEAAAEAAAAPDLVAATEGRGGVGQCTREMRERLAALGGRRGALVMERWMQTSLAPPAAGANGGGGGGGANRSSEGAIPVEAGQIVIAHRSAVRVYYSSRAAAAADKYPVTADMVSAATGGVNGYRGLRGDAKRLYKDVCAGRERRVQLLQARTRGVQLQMLRDAAVVVWAGGYQTNEVPLRRGSGGPLPVAHGADGQVSVDDRCRLTASGSAVPGLFGIGLGYGLPTSHPAIRGDPDTSARADGVAVYQNRVAAILLNQVLTPPQTAPSPALSPVPSRLAPTEGDGAGNAPAAAENGLSAAESGNAAAGSGLSSAESGNAAAGSGLSSAESGKAAASIVASATPDATRGIGVSPAEFAPPQGDSGGTDGGGGGGGGGISYPLSLVQEAMEAIPSDMALDQLHRPPAAATAAERAPPDLMACTRAWLGVQEGGVSATDWASLRDLFPRAAVGRGTPHSPSPPCASPSRATTAAGRRVKNTLATGPPTPLRCKPTAPRRDRRAGPAVERALSGNAVAGKGSSDTGKPGRRRVQRMPRRPTSHTSPCQRRQPCPALRPAATPSRRPTRGGDALDALVAPAPAEGGALSSPGFGPSAQSCQSTTVPSSSSSSSFSSSSSCRRKGAPSGVPVPVVALSPSLAPPVSPLRPVSRGPSQERRRLPGAASWSLPAQQPQPPPATGTGRSAGRSVLLSQPPPPRRHGGPGAGGPSALLPPPQYGDRAPTAEAKSAVPKRLDLSLAARAGTALLGDAAAPGRAAGQP